MKNITLSFLLCFLVSICVAQTQLDDYKLGKDLYKRATNNIDDQDNYRKARELVLKYTEGNDSVACVRSMYVADMNYENVEKYYNRQYYVKTTHLTKEEAIALLTESLMFYNKALSTFGDKYSITYMIKRADDMLKFVRDGTPLPKPKRR